MKAIVFHGLGDIRLDDVAEPKIEQPTDAIVRLTTSAICGTDLHMIRGTLGGMKPGTILGHEGVGVVEEVGRQVRNLRPGDRVVIPSTIACGHCSYCRAGYFAQCDNANPNGPRAGTCFYGGPQSSGPVNGMQAERVRVPFANVGPVRLPDDVSDDQAITVSDIFPTGYFGADLAEISDGDTVAVYGCGPVGLCAILSAFLMGAARVLAVDRIESRLEMARELGAETIDFEREHPVETILELTGGIGVDRCIDAVGVDAEPPSSGPAAEEANQRKAQYQREVEQVTGGQHPDRPPFEPGHAPSIVLEWGVKSLAKAGTLAVIGVYPPTANFFPFGLAMNRNVTINAGNCNHRKYMPHLIELIRSGVTLPSRLLTNKATLDDCLEAYRKFDQREPGWVKVEVPVSQRSTGSREKAGARR